MVERLRGIGYLTVLARMIAPRAELTRGERQFVSAERKIKSRAVAQLEVTSAKPQEIDPSHLWLRAWPKGAPALHLQLEVNIDNPDDHSPKRAGEGLVLGVTNRGSAAVTVVLPDADRSRVSVKKRSAAHPKAGTVNGPGKNRKGCRVVLSPGETVRARQYRYEFSIETAARGRKFSLAFAPGYNMQTGRLGCWVSLK